MPSILILEDDTVLLRLYSKVLTVQKYDVAQAATLDAARAHLAAAPFDLLLFDVQIGSELCTDLLIEQQDAIRQADTQVILMSADERYRTLREQLDLDLFVVKPVAPSELVQLVSAYLPIA